MIKAEYDELVTHAEELERTSADFRKQAKKARNEPDRAAKHAAAAAYEIEAVWVRGFIRRHANSE